MADRTIKPDSGNDLVLQNNGGGSKIEIPDSGDISISGTIGSGTFNGTIGTSASGSANLPIVKTAINASGSAPIFACRAAVHVEFASDFSTQSVTKFLNVSSLTKQTTTGTQYTVNFTTDLPDAAYIAVVGSGRKWAVERQLSVLVQNPDMTRTTSACQFGNTQVNTGSEALLVFNAAFFSE